MKFGNSFTIVFLLILILAKPSYAWSDWLCLKTEHFKVYYKSGHEPEARNVLATLEFYRHQVEKLCGNEIFDFAVVIDDAGTMANGFANPVNSTAHLFRYSPGIWGSVENWWSFVGTHEYIHGLSMSKTGGFPGVMNGIFGNFILFMPNMLTPGWVSEGITVYGESQLTMYQGRLNDGFYDAYLGARVAADRFPSILEATYQPMEFPLRQGIYNYGGEFFNYLANTYGEEKFAQFFITNGSSPGSLVPFLPKLGLDRSARKVFGKDFPELWKEWREYETSRFKDFQMEGRQETDTGWDMKYAKIQNGKLYYQQEFYRKTGAFKGMNFGDLIERDLATGKERKILTNINFATPFKIKNGKLYYTFAFVKTGYDNSCLRSFGQYVCLQEMDFKGKKNKTILRDTIRAFDILEDGRIIYSKDRPDRFGSEIFIKEPGSKSPKMLFQTDYLLQELESSDGRLITVARKDWETFSIFMLNLETQEFTPLIKTAHLEFGISTQGERLFFSANYQKKLSSYCYDFTTGKVYRLTENGLAIFPVYDENNNQLYYIGMNSNGYDIYAKPADFREFELPESPITTPPVLELPDVEISRAGYWENLKTLAPGFWMPMIDSDAQKFGLYFQGGDVVMDFPIYFGSIGYNYDTEEFIGDLNLEVNYFAPFHIGLSYEKDEETKAELTMDYPLFSVINVGASLGIDPDYDGVETKPFIELGDFLRLSAPKSRLVNGEEREAFYAQIKLSQYLFGGELGILAKYIDDPQNPDSVFEEIRGYDHELSAGKGRAYSFEYSHPLWKVRKGLWNPNIFLEDLTMTLFNDQAVPESGSKQESWGMELHMETRTGFLFSVDWGCRYTQNSDDDTTVELFIKSEI